MLEPSGAAPLPSHGQGDPVRPAAVLDGQSLRRDLEALYRDRGTALAEQLKRSGEGDGLDLVHEAFAKILALGSDKFQSVASPAAYVASISRNLLRDRARTGACHRAWAADQKVTAGEDHDPVVRLESRDTLRRLETALARLKPLTREIFIARRVDGLSYEEISKRTGLSCKAIEKHMAKAIARLTRLMDRS